MAQQTPSKSETHKQINSESSEEEDTIPQHLKTSIEEREYGTIPGSATATSVALSFTRAQCNPTVERGPPKKKEKTKVKKLPKEKAADKETQTPKPDEDK